MRATDAPADTPRVVDVTGCGTHRTRYLLALPLVWLALACATATHAAPAAEILPGCQGEGCGCYINPPEFSDKPAAKDGTLIAARPFTLHQQMDAGSPVLGHFKAGIRAKPLGEFSVIRHRGDYVITRLSKKVPGLNLGDRVHTMMYHGEGEFSVAKGNKRFGFDSDEDAGFKVIKPTKIEAWKQVAVGQQKGYTQDRVFWGCLE